MGVRRRNRIQCVIGCENILGQGRFVYCHNNGVVDEVGKILLDHYNTLEKTNRLIDYGEIWVLDENILLSQFMHRDRHEDPLKIIRGGIYERPVDEPVHYFVFTHNYGWEYSPTRSRGSMSLRVAYQYWENTQPSN